LGRINREVTEGRNAEEGEERKAWILVRHLFAKVRLERDVVGGGGGGGGGTGGGKADSDKSVSEGKGKAVHIGKPSKRRKKRYREIGRRLQIPSIKKSRHKDTTGETTSIIKPALPSLEEFCTRPWEEAVKEKLTKCSESPGSEGMIREHLS